VVERVVERNASEEGAMANKVTILICTRNRDDAVLATINGVLANSHADFDLLIVDQSSDAQTAWAIGSLERDSRLRYIHTNTKGLSTARNIGLAFSRDDLVLMTDDDCEVPPDWIAAMVAPFLCCPKIGIVFCDVVAEPYDPHAGFIPVSRSPRAMLIEDLAHWQTCDGVNIGIGASMAISRSVAEAIGGFHPLFGAGAYFRSGEDLDFTLRTLVANYQVCRINHISVVHHGFRTYQENRRLMRDAMYSAGAVYGSLLRHGQWRAIPYYVAMLIAMVIPPMIESLQHLRVPPVLGRAIWLVRGLVEGLCLPPRKPPRGLVGLIKPHRADAKSILKKDTVDSGGQ
jgi:glycosyltransferase involved in cell wall biosynthesis